VLQDEVEEGGVGEVAVELEDVRVAQGGLDNDLPLYLLEEVAVLDLLPGDALESHHELGGLLPRHKDLAKSALP
jgi:hypothetical protein